MLLAVFIGLTLGLVITYGVYTAQTAKNTQLTNATPLPSPTSGDTGENSTDLVITNPQDESVQRESELTVVGSTWAEAFVVILVNNKEFITTSDTSGAFSVKAKLDPGSNIISIHVIDEDGKTITQERTVILAADPTPEPTPSPTPRPVAKPKTASPSPTPAAP